MKITPAIASALFANGTTASSLLSTLAGGVSTSTAATREPLSALKDAEKNGPAYVAAKAKEPMVKRDLAATAKPLAVALPRAARDHHVLIVLAERDAIEVGEVPCLQQRLDFPTERVGLRGAHHRACHVGPGRWRAL